MNNEIIYNQPMKYKNICSMFNDTLYNCGNQRANQLKRWNKDFEVIKEKTYYKVLRERTDEEKEQIRNTKHYKNENHHIKNKEKYKQFNIKEKDRHSSGIYKIQLDNTIYIGQTNDFYNRFRHHYYNNFPTHDLLSNGATFSIIEKCDSQEKRNILEEKYIKQYSEDKNYVCINKDFNNYTHRKGKGVTKYKKIKINYDDWDKVIKILNKEGINYYE